MALWVHFLLRALQSFMQFFIQSLIRSRALSLANDWVCSTVTLSLPLGMFKTCPGDMTLASVMEGLAFRSCCRVRSNLVAMRKRLSPDCTVYVLPEWLGADPAPAEHCAIWIILCLQSGQTHLLSTVIAMLQVSMFCKACDN